MPILFCETRALAQEWAYRFLAAALVHAGGSRHVEREASELPSAAASSSGQVRAWGREHEYAVSDRGRISRQVLEAFARRHAD